MADIYGAQRLLEIWEEMRGAHRHDERRALVADAICASSHILAAVHEARATAVRLLRHGENASPETLERVRRWSDDY